MTLFHVILVASEDKDVSLEAVESIGSGGGADNDGGANNDGGADNGGANNAGGADSVGGAGPDEAASLNAFSSVTIGANDVFSAADVGSDLAVLLIKFSFSASLGEAVCSGRFLRFSGVE